jgi:hypothetical protein
MIMMMMTAMETYVTTEEDKQQQPPRLDSPLYLFYLSSLSTVCYMSLVLSKAKQSAKWNILWKLRDEQPINLCFHYSFWAKKKKKNKALIIRRRRRRRRRRR